jgi:hypothetical protein
MQRQDKNRDDKDENREVNIGSGDVEVTRGIGRHNVVGTKSKIQLE